jgi:hypothetical protein
MSEQTSSKVIFRIAIPLIALSPMRIEIYQNHRYAVHMPAA